MIMSTGTNIIHIFIKITHVIRLTYRINERWRMLLMKTLCHFNSIQFGRNTHTYDTTHLCNIWYGSQAFQSHTLSLYINRCSYSLHKFIEFLRAGENAFARKMINKKREIYTRELNMQHMAGVMLLFGHFCSFTFQIMGFLAEMLKSGSHTSRQHIQMSHTEYQTNTKKWEKINEKPMENRPKDQKFTQPDKTFSIFLINLIW